MNRDRDDHENATSTIWEADSNDGASMYDADCSPTRVCRNAREFTFEGIATDGGDLQAAWRDTLEREGKLNGSAGSMHELVLGKSLAD